MWRPKGWENPYGKYTEENDCKQNAKDFEAGADAMLEALKIKGDTQYGEVTFDIHANDYYFQICHIGNENMGERLGEGDKGWIVFIPDKED